MSAVSSHLPAPLESLELSGAQREIWLDCTIYPESAATYHIATCVRIEGRLDVELLAAATRHVLRAVPALRLQFSSSDVSRPSMRVVDALPETTRVLDFSACAQPEEEARKWMDTDVRRPFDLNAAPLCRHAILEIGARHYLWFSNYHHLLADGVGVGIVNRRIGEIYGQLARGVRPANEPAASILQAVSADREYAASVEAAEAAKYWSTLHASRAEPVSLSGAPPQSAIEPKPLIASATLDSRAVERLQSTARSLGVAWPMLTIAAAVMFLRRSTGAADLPIGVPVQTRRSSDRHSRVWMCANVLPMRFQLSARSTVRAAVRHVAQRMLEGLEHRGYAYERVKRDLKLSRADNLFDAMVNVFPDDPPVTLADCATRSEALSTGPIRDLAFLVFGTAAADTLRVEVRANPATYESWRVATILRTFVEFLERLPRYIDCPVSEVPLLEGDGAREVLTRWNGTRCPYPHDSSVHELFEEQADAHANDVAVEYAGREMTYAELNAASNRLAHHLLAQGVAAGDRIGICMERAPEMAITILAILKSGAAYVPLDPDHPPARIRDVADSAELRVLLTQERLAGALRTSGASCEVHAVDTLNVADLSAANPRIPHRGGELAYVIYTSGSTGRPKGVALPHRAVVNYLDFARRRYAMQAGVGAPVSTALSFDATVTSLLVPLVGGRRVVLLRHGRDELLELGARLADGPRYSLVKITPAQLQSLEALAPGAARSEAAGYFVIGGEALTTDHVAFWRTRAPEIRLINEYGPTETTVGCAIYEVSAQTRESGAIPIGRAIDNSRLYVLDEDLNPVPYGTTGELFIAGDGLAYGYWQQASLTAAAFVANPFAEHPGERMYRTGDLAFLRADGDLEYLGRKDRQVKVRGYRIELGEIEAAILQQENVSRCAVLPYQVGVSTQLVAYVVPKVSGTPLSLEALQRNLRASLPEYMVPTAAISLESLPMTINGKLDRAALPTPRPEASTARAYVAPRNEVEARLAEIWAQVLGLARVGIADHFLELGGDSILAMRIVAKAAAARIRVTPRQLFDYRSIGELASVSESIGGPLDNSAAPSDSDPLLTPIQRWFLDESDAPHHFNQSLVFELDASVDAVALREALQTVLACHDAFRLRFSRDESGVWRQWEAADAALADFWSDADLRPLLDESQAAEFAARCAAVQSSLDLGAGPLFKAVNFSLRDARCLLLTCHHLIVDWVSWRVLLDELNEAYARRLSGEPIVLSPPPYSFRQWGERLRRCVAAGELDADLPYWLDLAKTRTPIPVDFVGQDNRWRDLETCAVELDAEHTSWLLHEVPAAYRTQIHEVLLAALAPVLCDWMGDEEVVLDLEGHGRDGDDIDVSRTVGWFTSLFPVRLHPSASGSSLADTLRSVKEQVRAIPHRGMSYGALRYYSDDGEVRRRLADIRPAVSFNYLGKFDMRGPLLRASSRDPGPVYSPDATRPHLLEIVAFVRDRTLTFRWRYSRCWHAHSSIEQLARASIAGLRAIVAHCMQPGAGGFTPADFPLAKLSQQTLDRLYRRHSQMESRR